MGQKKGYKQTEEHVKKRAESQTTGSNFNCIVCGTEFWRKQYEIKRGNNKFCSKKCYFEWQKGRSKDLSNRRKYYGKDNPNWKGGIKTENNIIRDSKEMKEWRKSVFERDDWICRKCGKRSKLDSYLRIEAHHIRPFAKFPELRFKIDNGLTLCRKCHMESHKKNSTLTINISE